MKPSICSKETPLLSRPSTDYSGAKVNALCSTGLEKYLSNQPNSLSFYRFVVEAAEAAMEQGKLNSVGRVNLEVALLSIFTRTLMVKINNKKCEIPSEIVANLSLNKGSKNIVVVIRKDGSITEYSFQKANGESICFTLKCNRNLGSKDLRLDLFQPNCVRTEGDATYCGGLLNGMKHGIGVLTWPNGDKYDGNFENNEMNGTCVFSQTHENGQWSEYSGENLRGKPHGTGKMRYPDGRVYNGQWRDGMPHGTGEMRYPDGTVHNGQWHDGKKQGT